MIDPKDLRPFKANELQVGGFFYLKGDDGKFQTCQITEKDLADKWRAAALREVTVEFSKENRLFVRINKPWASFA